MCKTAGWPPPTDSAHFGSEISSELLPSATINRFRSRLALLPCSSHAPCSFGAPDTPRSPLKFPIRRRPIRGACDRRRPFACDCVYASAIRHQVTLVDEHQCRLNAESFLTRLRRFCSPRARLPGPSGWEAHRAPEASGPRPRQPSHPFFPFLSSTPRYPPRLKNCLQ
jgi:hypothetical protein